MKSFIKKYKLAIGAVGVFVVGMGTALSVFAAIPSAQGVINGCYSNQNGQLKIIDDTAVCTSGQTNLKWDRGVLAYGRLKHVNDGMTMYELLPGQSSNVVSVNNPLGYPDNAAIAACIDLPDSVMSSMRFVTTTGANIDVYVKDKSPDENTNIANYCVSGTDLLIVNTGSSQAYPYFSVF